MLYSKSYTLRTYLYWIIEESTHSLPHSLFLSHILLEDESPIPAGNNRGSQITHCCVDG